MMYSNDLLTMPEAADAGIQDQSNGSGEGHNNFRLASEMETGKIGLINGFSRFPATALWLLHRYETNAGESARMALGEIKHCFLQAGLAYSARRFDRQTENEQNAKLSDALRTYSYSFEDLALLSRFVVTAVQHRHGNQHGVSAKRFSGPEQVLVQNQLEAIDVSGFDSGFLFLPAGDAERWVAYITAAERRWLNSRLALAKKNSGLVLYIANQYKSGFLEFDDLVQEGQTGLLKAIDKFDCKLGFQFSTYAAYWIRQAILRALSRCERVVRIPCEQVANIHKVLRAKDELTSKLGRPPTVKELTEHSKLPDEQIHGILSISQTAVSLENLEDDEDSLAPIDILEQQIFTHPLNKIEQSDLKTWLNKAMKILDPRELRIISCHFGINHDKEMTLQEIGAELHLTRERVRQIQVKALNKLKLSYGKHLVSFL